MAENTKIEWADHTFNPWEGCQKVGPGCDHCYAETRNARFAGGTAANWGPGAPRRRTSTSNWNKPKAWNANAEAFMAVHGRRQRVFCASLADVFDNAVDPQWRADLFELIRATPNLDWLLLTKRIGNVRGMLAELAHGSDPDLSLLDMMPLPNVWIGATIVNQAEADRDIPRLLAVPAAKRFLSMEPLLGPVDLRFHIFSEPTGNFRSHAGKRQMELRKPADGWLHWVIVGGESGPGARPMHPDWARSLRDQCQAADVPFLFKQWGEWTPGENVERRYGTVATAKWFNAEWSFHEEGLANSDGHIDDEPDLYRIGKKAAGRLLDGRTWDGCPAPMTTEQTIQDVAMIARNGIDRVIELERENKRLAEALANANEQAERFEREWYLRGDEIESLQAQLAAIGAGGVEPLRSKADSVLEDALSDAVRVPLDSLHADAAYLIGRLRDGSMPHARVIEIIRERIDAAKAAIRARAAHGQAPADAAPSAGAVAGPDDIDAIALTRYKVAPAHESMFHRFAVVAGDGKQQLYLGRETECQNMTRKFAGAFLDGAFYQSQIAAAPTPAAQAADSVQEPFGYFRPAPFGWEDCAPSDEGAVALYAAPQPAPVAQGGVSHILAKTHTGMCVDYTGLLGQCQRALRHADNSGRAELLRQLQGHLQELGQGWYSGDTSVVDEFLQLYCIEQDARAALAQAKEGGAI